MLFRVVMLISAKNASEVAIYMTCMLIGGLYEYENVVESEIFQVPYMYSIRVM